MDAKFENLKLRPVKKEDYEKILEWRNDPEVRENMFNTRTITWEEHKKYWGNILKDREKFAFIIEREGQDLGIIRLEKKDEKAEVNIIIAPKFQKQGIGKTALKKIEEKAKELKISVLTSRIKPENKASMKIFEKNTYEKKYFYYEKIIE